MTHTYDGLPCLQEGCYRPAVKKARCETHQLPAFYGNYRTQRLPKNWSTLKAAVLARDKGRCYLCGEAGADSVDHIQNNDDDRMTNLAAAHQNVPNSKGELCHRSKTSQEGNAARQDQKTRQWGRTWQEEAYRRHKTTKQEEKTMTTNDNSNKQTPTTYLIIAAGEGTRWGTYLGLPKHLAPILKEPIIHRTQRLLTPHLKEDDQAYIVVHNPAKQRNYLAPETGFKLRKAKLTPENGDADKIISSQHLWNTAGRTVIIWGDTFLTDHAIETIASTTPDTWVAIARWGANPYTGCAGGENFAHVIGPDGYTEYSNAVERVTDLYKENIIPRNGGWEIYKALNNLPDDEIFKRLDDKGSTHNPKLLNAIEIVDGSEDFDSASDWDNWCWNYSRADNNQKQIMTKGKKQ